MKQILIMMFLLLSLSSCSKDKMVLEKECPTDIKPPTEISGDIQICVGSTIFSVSLHDTPAAKAFKEMLPMTINMGDLNDNEKYYYLPSNLPTSASRTGTIYNGDLMLYASNCLVLFYKTFSSSYSYTKIGQVDHPKGLESALGSGNISVTFELIK